MAAVLTEATEEIYMKLRDSFVYTAEHFYLVRKQVKAPLIFAMQHSLGPLRSCSAKCCTETKAFPAKRSEWFSHKLNYNQNSNLN